MVSKRTTGDSRAGELVRKRGGEEYPARRGTTELEEAKDSAVTAVRAGEGHGFFSFRYSFKEVSLAGGKTHIRSKERRYEDGKLSSEEFEATMDGDVYEDAAKQAQDFVAGQIASVFGLFSAFLPFSSRPKAK